jgi:hypothetical protein
VITSSLQLKLTGQQELCTPSLNTHFLNALPAQPFAPRTAHDRTLLVTPERMAGDRHAATSYAAGIAIAATLDWFKSPADKTQTRTGPSLCSHSAWPHPYQTWRDQTWRALGQVQVNAWLLENFDPGAQPIEVIDGKTLW